MREIKCLNCTNRAKNKFCSRACYYEDKRKNIYPGQFSNGHSGFQGELNGMFSPYAGYFSLHDWVKKRLGRPSLCENCGTTEAKKYEWANLSGECLRDLSDWARLCTTCHRLIDGHAHKMWATRRLQNA